MDQANTDVPQAGKRLLHAISPADQQAHRGEFVAIAVDTGQLFFAKVAADAVRAAEKVTRLSRVYLARVGASTAFTIGPRSS
jgi:hypothetical protein